MKKSKLLSKILSVIILFQAGAAISVNASDVSEVNEIRVPVLTWEQAKARANTNNGNWEKISGKPGIELNVNADYISFTGPAAATRTANVIEFPLESEPADGVLVVNYSFYVPSSSNGVSYSHIMELREGESKGVYDQTANTNGIGDIYIPYGEAGMQFGADSKNDICSTHPNRGTVGNGYYIPKDQWVRVKYTMDYANDKGETNVVYLNKSGGTMDLTSKYDLTDDYLEYAPALGMNVYTLSGAQIRIKDLTVERVRFGVEKTTLEDDFEGTSFDLTFSDDVDADKLKSAIIITDEKGIAVTVSDIAVSGTTATVTADFEKKHKYSVLLAKGADVGVGDEETAVPTQEEFNYTFTSPGYIEAVPVICTYIAAVSNGKLTLTPTVTNTTDTVANIDITAIVAVYDTATNQLINTVSDVLADCVYNTPVSYTGNKLVLDYNENYKYKLICLDSVTNMVPYMDVISVNAANS